MLLWSPYYNILISLCKIVSMSIFSKKGNTSGMNATGVASSDFFSFEVLNALSAHIAVIDREGQIQAVNNSWMKFADNNGGDSKALGVGCNYLHACRDALLPENIETGLEALHGIERVLQKELAEFELIYPCHSPDVKRWFLMRCTPMEGHSLLAVICHIDISEKIKTEEKLREREKELEAFQIIHRQVASQIALEPVIRTILEQIRSIIEPDLAMLFLKNGENLTLKDSVCSITSNYIPAKHEHQIGRCLCGIAVATGESVYSFDINTDKRCTMHECKDAGYTSFASIPLKKGTNILGCIGIASIVKRDFSHKSSFLESAANDVTISLNNALLYNKLQHYADDIQNELGERQRLEKSLVHTQKMEAIGHLAGGIAHDFNNTLAAIMGYSELTLQKTSDPESKEFIQGVLKACHRAKDLIKQILTFSRQNDISLIPIDLRAILKETLPLVKASLPSTITIHAQFESFPPAPVTGNPTQIQRVFMNLCTNAAQAMEDTGGALVIRVETVTIDPKMRDRCHDLAVNEQYVRLSVRDTGTGIAPEQLDSIFEPYFTTKVPGKGTGLGLAVVHGIMKSHHGGIIVDSFPGHGTTFSLYFPRGDKDQPIVRPEALPESARGSEHILLIDDEAAIVNVLRRTLERAGYTTTCCLSSKHAMSLFRQSPQKFDMVICDLTMPDLTGDELSARMRGIRPDIPIIMCTGHHPGQLQDVDTSNIDIILQKPIPHAKLAKIIRELLD